MRWRREREGRGGATKGELSKCGRQSGNEMERMREERTGEERGKEEDKGEGQRGRGRGEARRSQYVVRSVQMCRQRSVVDCA